ncbi:MAG TPA: RpiB/LacA/LacB family sugar-phosphate isomerase, partial [Acidimicrobiales bacterium]|nr:RpiB/LacA/LacB family sugar-phosphate isomerase [Acidimicrobiales bacterium]
MRIAFGSDHAGFDLKGSLATCAGEWGHEVVDLGTWGTDSVDYPDFGAAVGQAVASGSAELGICVCGTGIGISIAA